jgi:hypothetical protein
MKAAANCWAMRPERRALAFEYLVLLGDKKRLDRGDVGGKCLPLRVGTVVRGRGREGGGHLLLPGVFRPAPGCRVGGVVRCSRWCRLPVAFGVFGRRRGFGALATRRCGFADGRREGVVTSLLPAGGCLVSADGWLGCAPGGVHLLSGSVRACGCLAGSPFSGLDVWWSVSLWSCQGACAGAFRTGAGSDGVRNTPRVGWVRRSCRRGWRLWSGGAGS